MPIIWGILFLSEKHTEPPALRFLGSLALLSVFWLFL